MKVVKKRAKCFERKKLLAVEITIFVVHKNGNLCSVHVKSLLFCCALIFWIRIPNWLGLLLFVSLQGIMKMRIMLPKSLNGTYYVYCMLYNLLYFHTNVRRKVIIFIYWGFIVHYVFINVSMYIVMLYLCLWIRRNLKILFDLKLFKIQVTLALKY